MLLQDQHFKGKVSAEDVNSLYYLGKELGSGKFGIVRLIAKKSLKRKMFALKSIPRSKIGTDFSSGG